MQVLGYNFLCLPVFQVTLAVRAVSVRNAFQKEVARRSRLPPWNFQLEEGTTVSKSTLRTVQYTHTHTHTAALTPLRHAGTHTHTHAHARTSPLPTEVSPEQNCVHCKWLFKPEAGVSDSASGLPKLSMKCQRFYDFVTRLSVNTLTKLCRCVQILTHAKVLPIKLQKLTRNRPICTYMHNSHLKL